MESLYTYTHTRLYLNNIQNTTLQNAYVCNQNKVIIKILI